MANEIKVTASLEVTNGQFKFPRDGGTTVNIDQATPGGGVPGLVLATNAAQGVVVSFTGVTTPAWLRMENLDSAAEITWGPETGGTTLVPLGLMKPGEPVLLRLAGSVVLRLKSSIASSKVKVTVMEA